MWGRWLQKPPTAKLDHRVNSRFLILAFKAFLILFSTILCDWVHISIALTTNRNKEYKALFFRNYANVQTYSSSLASVPTHQDIFSVLTSPWQCLPLLNFYYMRITGSDFWKSKGNDNETTFPRSIVIRLGTTGRVEFYQESLYINEKRCLLWKIQYKKRGVSTHVQ